MIQPKQGEQMQRWTHFDEKPQPTQFGSWVRFEDAEKLQRRCEMLEGMIRNNEALFLMNNLVTACAHLINIGKEST